MKARTILAFAVLLTSCERAHKPAQVGNHQTFFSDPEFKRQLDAAVAEAISEARPERATRVMPFSDPEFKRQLDAVVAGAITKARPERAPEVMPTRDPIANKSPGIRGVATLPKGEQRRFTGLRSLVMDGWGDERNYLSLPALSFRLDDGSIGIIDPTRMTKLQVAREVSDDRGLNPRWTIEILTTDGKKSKIIVNRPIIALTFADEILDTVFAKGDTSGLQLTFEH